MTVCIGALFRWNYDTTGKSPKWETVALAVSDRMVTSGSGDIEYEPGRQKIAFIKPHIVLLIAGDYSVHSQALKTVFGNVENRANVTPFDVATLYGIAIQAIQRKITEDLYLAPFNLNTDSFLAQQKDLSHSFVETITDQLQKHKHEEVSALIMGVAGNGAHLYEVNTYGVVACHDDIGFASIGIGGGHSNLTFMQAGYANNWPFAPVLSIAYAAKRAAEIAPGVGKATDIHIIFRDRTERLREDVAEKLPTIYAEFTDGRASLAADAIKKMEEAFLVPKPAEGKTEPGTAPKGDSVPAGRGTVEGAKKRTKKPK